MRWFTLQRDAYEEAPAEAMPTLFGGCWEDLYTAVTVIELTQV